jgi:IS30 family transposase
VTPAFRAEVWRRWKAGESCSEIARALSKHSAAIYTFVARRGAVAPVQRRRSRWALPLNEREEISGGSCAGQSMRTVAKRLGRAPSSVSREIARHGGRSGYRALQADTQARRNALRPKVCRLARYPALARCVAEKRRQEWSPGGLDPRAPRTRRGSSGARSLGR